MGKVGKGWLPLDPREEIWFSWQRFGGRRMAGGCREIHLGSVWIKDLILLCLGSVAISGLFNLCEDILLSLIHCDSQTIWSNITFNYRLALVGKSS